MEVVGNWELNVWPFGCCLIGLVVTFQYITYYDHQYEETITGYIKQVFSSAVIIETKYKIPKELFCFYCNIKGDIKPLTEEEIIIWKLE